MADSYGGRVLAGEDSEEDDDEDEGYNFQFSATKPSTPSVTLPAAPRFSVQISTPSTAVEGEESEEEEEKEEEEEEKSDTEDDNNAVVKKKTEADENVPPTSKPEQEAKVEIDSDSRGISIAAAPSTLMPAPPKEDEWRIDGSLNGIDLMSEAFVETIRPSLDASLRRICELTENQERLLRLLQTQSNGLTSSKQLQDVAAIMDKLPHYCKKIQQIKAMMSDITTSVDKMKTRAENLRIDAQSHAINKENKRDAMSQWNKLYAAKSTEVTTAASGAPNSHTTTTTNGNTADI